jgi:hypothetical protein
MKKNMKKKKERKKSEKEKKKNMFCTCFRENAQ